MGVSTVPTLVKVGEEKWNSSNPESEGLTLIRVDALGSVFNRFFKIKKLFSKHL